MIVFVVLSNTNEREAICAGIDRKRVERVLILPWYVKTIFIVISPTAVMYILIVRYIDSVK